MAKVEIDNKKMWESILKRNSVSWVGTLIKRALKDQGLEYKDGNIISIEPEPLKIEAGKFYVCINNKTEHGVISYTEGKTYQSQHDNFLPNDSGKLCSWCVNAELYFRLATEEEMHSEQNMSGWLYDMRMNKAFEFSHMSTYGVNVYDKDGNCHRNEDVRPATMNEIEHIKFVEDIEKFHLGQEKEEIPHLLTDKERTQEIISFLDNREAKFKEGDWVVLNNDVCQIVKREEGCNQLVTQYGIQKELVNERTLSTARLWDVTKDAKDGDVLIIGDEDGTGIAIFNKLVGIGNACLHCSLDMEEGFNTSVDISRECCIRPATQGECDTLFKAMADAGYLWNPIEKKLEKIVVPEFKEGDIIRHKGGDDTTYEIIKVTETDYFCKDNHSWSIKSQDNFELVEPEPNLDNTNDTNTIKFDPDAPIIDTNKIMKSLTSNKRDICEGCNNFKGCIACVDGDNWVHIYDPDKNKGLTEFESYIEKITNTGIEAKNKYSSEMIKTFAEDLLSIARKQIASEINVGDIVNACAKGLSSFAGEYEHYKQALLYQYQKGIGKDLCLFKQNTNVKYLEIMKKGE